MLPPSPCGCATRPVFDSHAAAQKDVGLTLEHLWRGLGNPHEVFFLFEVADVAKARAFVTAPAAGQAKHESGVKGETDIWFVEVA